MKKTPSQQVLNSVVPPVAAWVVGKLLEPPRIRSVKRASRNAASNPAWLAAGAGAIVIGILLMAKATRK